MFVCFKWPHKLLYQRAMGRWRSFGGAWGMMTGDGEVAMEVGDKGLVSIADEAGWTKEIGGAGEERESGGGGSEGWRSAMTTKGGKPGRGDAASGVRKSEGAEKKEESS